MYVRNIGRRLLTFINDAQRRERRILKLFSQFNVARSRVLHSIHTSIEERVHTFIARVAFKKRGKRCCACKVPLGLGSTKVERLS